MGIILRRTADWMKQADGELKAAEDLYTTQNYTWCCFTCHQAAEKSLKAILEHFRTPTYGHNLLILLNDINPHISIPSSISNACNRLNKLYIPTRYPDAFPSGAPIDMYNKLDADTSLKDAKEVIAFARRVIGSP
jgi:HEPN domain-containing protein